VTKTVTSVVTRLQSQFWFFSHKDTSRMHCASRLSELSPTGGAKRDAVLAAILAQSMKKYASGGKRGCPFAAPTNKRQRRRPDDDLQALQQDVEELEARVEAARRRKQPPAKKQANVERLRSVLEACSKQKDATVGFGYAAACTMNSGQLEYEPSVDAPVFRQMEKGVADQLDHLAQVFRDAGLHESKKDFVDARVVTGDKQGTFVRFATSKVAPFPLDAGNGAMWTGAKKSSVLNKRSDPDDEDGIMYIKRECVLPNESLGAAGIRVLLRGVCRRIVEPHRIVVVWEGMGDWPKEYLRCHPSSVPIRERGYSVVQTFDGGSTGGRAAPLSLFQSCICMTPGLSAGIDMGQPECLQMLSDAVIPSYRKILDAREQMLENAILDEMIHSKMRGPACKR